MDGTYDIVVQMPIIGKKCGILQLKTGENSVNGRVQLMGKTQQFSGRIQDNTIQFQMKVTQPLIGEIDFQFMGTIDGVQLHGIAKSKHGSAKVFGTRR